MSTLYELTTDMREVLARLDAAEADPETGEVLAPDLVTEILDELEGEYANKLDAFARVVRTLDAESDMVLEEAKRLAARAEALTRQAERLKEAMRVSLVATGTKSVRTQLFTIGLAASPERVEVTDLEAVPQEYRRVPPPPPRPSEYPPDKDAAKRDLKAGKEIPGLALVRGEPRLSIR